MVQEAPGFKSDEVGHVELVIEIGLPAKFSLKIAESLTGNDPVLVKVCDFTSN